MKKIKQLFRKRSRIGTGGGHDTVRPANSHGIGCIPAGKRSHSLTAMTGTGIPSVISRRRLIMELRSAMRERPGPGSMPTEIMPTVSSRESPCIPGTHWREDASVVWNNLGKAKAGRCKSCPAVWRAGQHGQSVRHRR